MSSRRYLHRIRAIIENWKNKFRLKKANPDSVITLEVTSIKHNRRTKNG